MYSELNNDTLACLVKSHPEIEAIIQTIISDNKQTTSMFVHELRNPLSLLKGTIQYIEKKYPESAEFKYWNQMQDLINDMEAMMVSATVLNTCNILNKNTTNLFSLISGIVDSFMPQAISQQIDLTLAIEKGSESHFASYNCDYYKLKQAITNLIKNAFEATKSGDYIHINLGHLLGRDQVPPKLLIQIINNGLPIPEDEINNIFLPFVTYKKGGTGIGLAVVKKIIDLHYGSISVVSKDELIEFTILLPL